MATNWNGTGDGVSIDDAGNWDNGVPGLGNDGMVVSASISGSLDLGGGSITFDNSSFSGGTISNGDIFFNSGSSSSGTLTSASGQIVFNNAESSGLIEGNPTFQGLGSNAGQVTGNATFEDNSTNYGTVDSNATFNDASGNYGAVNGFIIVPWERSDTTLSSTNPNVKIRLVDVPEGGSSARLVSTRGGLSIS